MNRQWQSVLRAMQGQPRNRPARRFHLQLESFKAPYRPMA
jgi:hypothetical protein